MTEASLEALDGQASQERRALWASRGLDFLGLLAPKVNLPEPEREAQCSGPGPGGLRGLRWSVAWAVVSTVALA